MSAIKKNSSSSFPLNGVAESRRRDFVFADIISAILYAMVEVGTPVYIY